MARRQCKSIDWEGCVMWGLPWTKKTVTTIMHIKSEHCSFHGISKNQAWLRFSVQRCASRGQSCHCANLLIMLILRVTFLMKPIHHMPWTAHASTTAACPPFCGYSTIPLDTHMHFFSHEDRYRRKLLRSFRACSWWWMKKACMSCPWKTTLAV